MKLKSDCNLDFYNIKYNYFESISGENLQQRFAEVTKDDII